MSSTTPEEERSRRGDETYALLRAAFALFGEEEEEEEESMSEAATVALSIFDATFEAKQGPSPATKASIAALPRKVVAAEEEGGGECAICLSEYEVIGCEVREMPCKHCFHSDCVQKWLLLNGSCPVCRFALPLEDNTEAERTALLLFFGAGESGFHGTVS